MSALPIIQASRFHTFPLCTIDEGMDAYQPNKQPHVSSCTILGKTENNIGK